MLSGQSVVTAQVWLCELTRAWLNAPTFEVSFGTWHRFDPIAYTVVTSFAFAATGLCWQQPVRIFATLGSFFALLCGYLFSFNELTSVSLTIKTQINLYFIAISIATAWPIRPLCPRPIGNAASNLFCIGNVNALDSHVATLIATLCAVLVIFSHTRRTHVPRSDRPLGRSYDWIQSSCMNQVAYTFSIVHRPSLESQYHAASIVPLPPYQPDIYHFHRTGTCHHELPFVMCALRPMSQGTRHQCNFHDTTINSIKS